MANAVDRRVGRWNVDVVVVREDDLTAANAGDDRIAIRRRITKKSAGIVRRRDGDCRVDFRCGNNDVDEFV